MAAATEYFEKAKIFDSDGNWSGPPKEFLTAKAELESASKSVELDAHAAGGDGGSLEKQGLTEVLWDNALYISAGAVAVAFAFHYYKKMSSS